MHTKAPGAVLLTKERAAVGYTALMDWSSFLKLTSKQSVELLRQKLTAPGDPMRYREILGPFLTDLLARLVVYDGLVLDTAGNAIFNNPLSSEALRVAQVRFEPDVYESAANSTLIFIAAMQAVGADHVDLLQVNDLFFSDLKNYADQISRRFTGLSGGIADSGQTVPRAVFYLELARELGLQLFVSYEKRDLLKNLNKLLWQDAFSILAASVDAEVLKVKPAGVDEPDIRLQTPAVVDLIIRRALERKISLEESIVQVRHLDGAQEFRDLLRQIQRLLMLGDKPSLLRINKLMAPLLKAANTWSVAADPEVRWRWKANISKLPKIGEFLEALGVELPPLMIKSRFNSYVQFVSEWYKTESQSPDTEKMQ